MCYNKLRTVAFRFLCRITSGFTIISNEHLIYTNYVKSLILQICVKGYVLNTQCTLLTYFNDDL